MIELAEKNESKQAPNIKVVKVRVNYQGQERIIYTSAERAASPYGVRAEFLELDKSFNILRNTQSILKILGYMDEGGNFLSPTIKEICDAYSNPEKNELTGRMIDHPIFPIAKQLALRKIYG